MSRDTYRYYIVSVKPSGLFRHIYFSNENVQQKTTFIKQKIIDGMNKSNIIGKADPNC